MDRYTRCRWPELPPATGQALRAVVRFILQRFDPEGIIATGTHISGNPDPSSDLDIHVIHAAPQRQRIQRWFEGIPAEIFVNPPASLRRYFAAEIRRPSTAQALASGFVVLDEAPIVEQLRREAETWLRRRLALSDTELTVARYMAADAFDNARDVRERNPATAVRILNGVVDGVLDYAFLSRGETLPRAKAYLDELSELDASLGELAKRYYLAQDTDERFALADELAARTAVERGFFEWESPLEPVAPEHTPNPTDSKERE